MKSSRASLMKLKRFQVDEKRRQVAQIELMVAEFERMAAELAEQIDSEERRAGITDVGHFAYPTFARAATVRRDNLLGSAADLRLQLAHAEAALDAALEEMKRAEQMEERDRAGGDVAIARSPLLREA